MYRRSRSCAPPRASQLGCASLYPPPSSPCGSAMRASRALSPWGCGSSLTSAATAPSRTTASCRTPSATCCTRSSWCRTSAGSARTPVQHGELASGQVAHGLPALGGRDLMPNVAMELLEVHPVAKLASKRTLLLPLGILGVGQSSLYAASLDPSLRPPTKGVPRFVPAVLDAFATKNASLPLDR